MKRRWDIGVWTLAGLMAVTGSTFGAFFDGGGDGTNWSDNVNWSNDTLPLTGEIGSDATVDIRSHQPAGSNDVVIILDAATADGFQDGVSGNFFNTRSSITNRDMTLYLDWGTSHTNGGAWWGSQSGTFTGSITHVQTGGNLYLTGASYFGRSSPNGQSIVYDLQGGSLKINQPLIGARSDAKGDITLRISGGAFDNQDVTGTRRVSLGGYDGGTATLEITSNSVVNLYDYRGDNSGADAAMGTGGSTYFRVIGSDAAITFAPNFDTDQDGKSNLVNQCEWIADAGGVSAITGLTTNDTFRPKSITSVLVDLTDYAGSEDLILARYGRYDGGVFGEVTIIDPLHRGYAFVMDNKGNFTTAQPTLSLRTYLTIPRVTSLSVESGMASMVYSAPTDTGVVYKLEATVDLTNAGAWTPTGAELPGTGGDLVFSNAVDSATKSYRITD